MDARNSLPRIAPQPRQGSIKFQTQKSISSVDISRPVLTRRNSTQSSLNERLSSGEYSEPTFQNVKSQHSFLRVDNPLYERTTIYENSPEYEMTTFDATNGEAPLQCNEYLVPQNQSENEGKVKCSPKIKQSWLMISLLLALSLLLVTTLALGLMIGLTKLERLEKEFVIPKPSHKPPVLPSQPVFMPPSSRGHPMPTTSTAGTLCEDRETSCTSWSAAGYCSYNSNVQKDCRKSCNLCGTYDSLPNIP